MNIRPSTINTLKRALALATSLLCLIVPLKGQSPAPPGQENLGALAQAFYRQQTAAGHGLAKDAAVSRKSFNGAASNDNFGISVSSAGDVNGDGYSDIIVGAYGYNSQTGRAFVFFGGPSMNNSADVILTGKATGSYFGYSVSSAGDVNGDGYDDVIVGAYGSSSNTGRAYIYYGGSSMNNTEDVTLYGVATSDYFGRSVSSAGDVNGDGYDDVIVGASGYNSNTGRAYIFYGGSTMDNAVDVMITGETLSNFLGASVSSAGDVNGDGYSDVIVGASGLGGDIGRAYVLFGGPSMDNIADVFMTGEAAGNYFGYSVSSAGDVNGDGYADVIVGAYGYNSNTGRAYIYYGGSSMNNTADVTMTGDTTNNNFGYSVSSGDVNGDGYDDVIVGARGYGSNTGRAYVFKGGQTMDNTVDIAMTGEATGSYFGSSVSSAGDVNGDGYTDVIVGAQGYNSSTGRVYLYENSLTGSDIPDETFTGAGSNNLFGMSVSSAGDVNGDGYTDVVVGASGTGSSPHRAYVFYGGPGMDNTADVTMAEPVANEQFGTCVSTAGDVNGDGYSDIIVSAEAASRAYIFFGGPSMDSTADLILAEGVAGDHFGYSVSSAGDVNGDGYSDVIIGAPDYNSSTGRAYIFYGGPSMDSTADVIMTGQATDNFFGWSVSTAGDVNGDGYSDAIVGASGYNGFMGRAYIYYGGSGMNNAADVTMTDTTSNQFGWSVSTAGDVNGDGYSDVIVGANKYGGWTGRAYVFYGGSNMNNTADVTIAGEANSQMGSSVSTAGDVNGDGYSDVIVGASGYGSNTGRAYVFFGGSSVDSIADVIVTGEAGNNDFGMSVSSGDVNGDGYGDVIVGAYGYGGYAGRAYLYRSSSPPTIPHIMSVKDTPFDQGGNVTIKWARSAYDAAGYSMITSYTIERSLPPNSSGYFWEEVASITPRHNPGYSYTCPMPFDSMSGTTGRFSFRVTAQTSDADHFWHSNIVSGYSIDNLPPSTPSNPMIAPLTGGPIQLHWQPDQSDPDVGGYVVYRSGSPGFSVGPASRLATIRDTLYVDSTTSVGNNYYYRITTADIHGNESTPTAELSEASLAVQLSAFTGTIVNGRRVELHWSTASEVDLSGFEVQRRKQGDGQWLVLGMVEGHGTTSSRQQYTFADQDLQPGTYGYRLRQIERSGASHVTAEITVEVSTPSTFALSQNYPNPFNPSTNIEFELPAASHVTILVYDALGRIVKNIMDEDKAAGYYQIVLNGADLPSGVYYYRMTAGTFAETKRLVLLR